MFIVYNGRSYNIELPKERLRVGSPLAISHVLSIETKAIAEVLEKCKSRGVFVDVGASEGIWTINMAKVFERVISFEPHPLSFEVLKRNTANLRNVVIYNYALSDTYIETYKMIEWDQNYGMTKRFVGDEIDQALLNVEKQKTFVTKSYPLDDIVDRIDCMKIDAEGQDENVLAGASRLIKECNPYIHRDI